MTTSARSCGIPRAHRILASGRLVLALLCATLLAGCTSTKISDRQEYEGGPLPRPDCIIVYGFAATPTDLPAWSDERQAYADASERERRASAFTPRAIT